MYGFNSIFLRFKSTLGGNANYVYPGAGNKSQPLQSSQNRSYFYDVVGNLAQSNGSDEAQQFGYDAFNRLGAYCRDGVLRGDYRNNALNQRVYIGANYTATRYVYGPILQWLVRQSFGNQAQIVDYRLRGSPLQSTGSLDHGCEPPIRTRRGRLKPLGFQRR